MRGWILERANIDVMQLNNNNWKNNLCINRRAYPLLGEEAVVINALAATLIALMIVMPVIMLYEKFRPKQIVIVHGI